VSTVSDPVVPGAGRPDSTRRPDYEALAHPDGPVPESAAWNVLSYLLAGLVGFGLPAWFLDRWLGTTWIVGVGILAGTAVAMTTIWFRYGTGGTGSPGSAAAGTNPSAEAPADHVPPGRGSRPRTSADVDHPSHDAPDASPLEDKP
jgi:hypothetical protein